MAKQWRGLLAGWLALPALASGYHSSSQDIGPWGDGASQDGLAPRFIRFVAREAGLALTQDVRPLPRVIEELKQGRNALALVTASPERSRFAVELCRPASIRISVLYHRRGLVTPIGPSWFRQRSLGVLRGTHTLDGFIAQSGAAPVEVSDMPQGFRMLQAGRLDAMMCVRPGCGHALRQMGGSLPNLTEYAQGDEPMALYVSKRSELARDAAMLGKLKAACLSAAGRREMAELLTIYD
ncbi:transporter substrate-binding domain-containing protein [Chromobacterium sp. S0633]|uniref:substrate-binding periplasmic protein n=1 Tax=Chromobacterium sp. S0633 TaxID=2957805 RepID=UPI00209D44FD|nr:transporter substrate-binding domain-containing protein [Chromobacterium sp. S0633]MCP1291337.1 transporter substrate-binding domain-containing protein [Chromobacterium sp. S0633]